MTRGHYRRARRELTSILSGRTWDLRKAVRQVMSAYHTKGEAGAADMLSDKMPSADNLEILQIIQTLRDAEHQQQPLPNLQTPPG